MRPSVTFAVLMAGSTLLASAGAQEPALGPTILHVPVKEHEAEQGILTPIPVSIEVPPTVAARRVLLHYRVFGSDGWTTLELQPRAQRWSGAIPCLEVSTITGDVSYYIRIHDAGGRVLAYSGTRAVPYKVRIVHDTARSSETLVRPRCPDPSDCPAGLLGCPSAAVERVPCEADHDCEGGMTCSWEGYCEHDRRRYTWVGAGVAQELGLVDTTGACSIISQESRGYSCYRDLDGELYTGHPAYTNEPLKVGPGPSRVLLAAERVVSRDTSIGVRLGWAVLGEGPTAPGGVGFVPLLGEARVTHWFGDDPFARARTRPFVFVSGGYGMFDLRVTTHVREDPTAYQLQGGNDLEQRLTVWKRAGDGFMGFGGGVSRLLTGRTAARAELAVMKVFPFGAVVATPRIGLELGL